MSSERQCWFLAEILYTLQQLLLACQLLDSLMVWDNIYYPIISFSAEEKHALEKLIWTSIYVRDAGKIFPKPVRICHCIFAQTIVLYCDKSKS